MTSKPRTTSNHLLGLAISSSLALVASCTNVPTRNVASGLVQCVPLTKRATAPSAHFRGSIFTIVMENKSASEIFGNPDAPFINALANQNAIAKGYVNDLIHPSEPNYLAMVAGNSFGVADNADPAGNHIKQAGHIVDQLELQGMSWKGYMESMGEPCKLASAYPYAAKHNPFVFFDNINGWDGAQFASTPRCQAHVVDYRELDQDLAVGTVPKYVFITPNMINDMHDGSIADGDQWLAREVPKILSSPAFNDGGVLFLTWDEGGGSPPRDDPPMIVVGANVKPGYVSTTPFNTDSYVKTVQKILGLEPLPCNSGGAGVATMDELFTVPLDADLVTNPAP